MATISETERYAELLTHTDFVDWHMFVIGACYVIEKHTGEDQQMLAIGLIEAKRQEVDWSQLHWRLYLWQLGAEADFIERLERALSVQAPNDLIESNDGIDSEANDND